MLSKRFLNTFFLLILSLSGYSFATSSATPESEFSADIFPEGSSLSKDQQELMQQAMQEVLEQTYNQLLHSLEKIDCALEHLALIVNNNQIRSVNKKEVIPHIYELRQTIAHFKKSKVVTVTAPMIVSITQITYALACHVHNFIKGGLKEFDEFDPAQFIKRSPSKEIDFEQLQSQLQESEEIINSLEHATENAGLNVFNKVFRKAEKLNKNYRILRWLGYSTLAGLIVSYITFRAPEETINRYTPFLMPLKRILGEPTTKHGYDDFYKKSEDGSDNSHKIGVLTEVDETLGRRMELINFGCGGLISFAMFQDQLKSFGTKAYDWTSKRLSVIASYLRGGPIKRVFSEYEKDPKANFDDVIGNDEAKEKLKPLIQYVLNHEKFDQSGIVPPTGVLLIGAPRTGKSFIAEATAGEIKRSSNEKVRMLELTAAELKAMGITKVFEIASDIARETGPIILMIDEIDTGGFLRSGENADNQALCELLAALSMLNRKKSNKIVVMGCTNKPENIDPALLEPGRLGIHIYFTYPPEEQRKEFLNRELSNRTISLDDRYLDELAHKTEDCSFDALSQVLTTALQRAKIRGTSLQISDLDLAYQKEINRIVVNEMSVPDEEQQIVAIHQAGEIVARTFLNTKKHITAATAYPVYPDITTDLDEDTINSRSLKNTKLQYGKVFTAHNRNMLTGVLKGTHMLSAKFSTKEDHMNEIRILLAGDAAEQMINGSSSYVYSKHNHDQALELAKYMVFKGRSTDMLPKVIREEKLVQAYAIVEECTKEVEELLRHHEAELLALANELHERKLLTAQEIQEIITNANTGFNDIKEPELSLDDLLKNPSQITAEAA